MAMLIQTLSAKLGIATGKNLPEVCRERFPRRTAIGLWFRAEVIAMATDLAEFLGAALGFPLLLGISLFPAALITGATAFAILWLQRFGFRPFEATIAAIVGFIGVCYLGELFMAKPPLVTVAHHAVVPQFAGGESVLLAVGILGATVMPHVIYLHSALLQNRIRPETDEQARRLMRFTRVDVVIAMSIAGLINMAMLVMAASVFFKSGLVHVESLERAHETLRPILGGGSSTLFALALLASGLSSSTVGTLSGQVVMQGFIRRQIPVVVRRLVTMLPALVVVGIGVDPSRTLVISQVVLSFGIPFALVPLVLFTSRRDGLGVDAHLEVEVRAEAVAGAADVADHLALRDRRSVPDRERRLVPVGGREPLAVVDHRQVAVPRHPTRIDDRARRGRMDRSAVWDADVDPLVHAAPAHAERARDRPLHRPDEPARGDAAAGRAGRGTPRLGGLDLGRELCAHLREPVRLVQVLALALLDRCQALPLLRPRRDERRSARHQAVAHGPLLVRPSRDRLRLGRHAGADLLRARTRGGHGFLGRVDLVREPLILGADLVQVVELVDEVGEARGGEEDGHRVGVISLVDGDEAPVEAAHGLPVLRAEENEAAAFEPVELGQPLELLPVELEVALERDEPVARARHLPLERADLAVERRDLRRQHALLGARPGDPVVERLDPVLDRLLALVDVVSGGRCGENEREEEE